MEDPQVPSAERLAKVAPPSWIPLISGNGRIRKQKVLTDDWRINAKYLVLNPDGWAELGSPPRVVLFQKNRDLYVTRGDGLLVEEAPGSGAPAVRLSQRYYLRQLLLPGVYRVRICTEAGLRVAIFPGACFTSFNGRRDFAIFLTRTSKKRDSNG